MAIPDTHTAEVPVFFSTTEGQTRRIAERAAALLREEGFDSRAVSLAGGGSARVDWTRVAGAVVAAPLHAGSHGRDVAAFVRPHLAELNARPTIFLSVSLSAASKTAEGRAPARTLADAFPASLGWRPAQVEIVAGRLAYTKYGLVKRIMLKRIARKEGAPTDTSRDYEFTDWAAVETLMRGFAGTIRAGAETRRGGSSG